MICACGICTRDPIEPVRIKGCIRICPESSGHIRIIREVEWACFCRVNPVLISIWNRAPVKSYVKGRVIRSSIEYYCLSTRLRGWSCRDTGCPPLRSVLIPCEIRGCDIEQVCATRKGSEVQGVVVEAIDESPVQFCHVCSCYVCQCEGEIRYACARAVIRCSIHQD